MIYIIAYDIADNKRRLRVAKTLESWGYRIQESVFQLRLDNATLARVRSSLAALISEGDDVIHIYPICSSCADRADILGAAIALDDVGLWRECGESCVLRRVSLKASAQYQQMHISAWLYSQCFVPVIGGKGTRSYTVPFRHSSILSCLVVLYVFFKGHITYLTSSGISYACT